MIWKVPQGWSENIEAQHLMYLNIQTPPMDNAVYN